MYSVLFLCLFNLGDPFLGQKGKYIKIGCAAKLELNDITGGHTQCLHYGRLSGQG